MKEYVFDLSKEQSETFQSLKVNHQSINLNLFFQLPSYFIFDFISSLTINIMLKEMNLNLMNRHFFMKFLRAVVLFNYSFFLNSCLVKYFNIFIQEHYFKGK